MTNNKGYITIAQKSGDNDYIKMAYALALSLKITQCEINKLSICVENENDVPDKYKHAFDKIIEIPWKDHAKNSIWKIENKWKYIYMSPYDETVVLDADMIFLSDVSYWWKYLTKKDVWFCTNPRTFKNELIKSDYYRKTFTANKLPNIYSAFFFFRKSTLAFELFKMTEIIMNNWELYYYTFLDEHRPKHNSGDVSFSLAIKILGIENECIEKNIFSLPTFVHMKSHAQNIPENYLTENWTENIPTYFHEDCKLKVSNFAQILPFHYHRKEWLTDDIIHMLERKVTNG